MLLGLLFREPLLFVILALALIISLSLHEAAHAFVADKLGDPTARLLGRVTINPLAHLDPLGTLLLLTAGFGWGKPVPFNPFHLRKPKRDAALISFAGPFINFVLAGLFALMVHFFYKVGYQQSSVVTFCYFGVFYNLMLGFFNLVPIHPLDGFKVIYGLLPGNLAIQWMQMEPFGIYLLLILVMTGSFRSILDPFINFSLILLGLGS